MVTFCITASEVDSSSKTNDGFTVCLEKIVFDRNTDEFLTEVILKPP